MIGNKKFWIIGALISGLVSYFLFNMGITEEGSFSLLSYMIYAPGIVYGILLMFYFSNQSKKHFLSIKSLILVIVSTASFAAAYQTTMRLVIYSMDNGQEGFTIPLFVGGVAGMLLLYAGLSFTFIHFKGLLWIGSLFLSGLLGQAFTLGMYTLEWLGFTEGSNSESVPYLFLFVFWQVGIFLFIRKLSLKNTLLQTNTPVL